MSTSKLTEQMQKRKAITANKQHNRNSIKWRTIIGLIMLYVVTIMDWQWAWGILFLFWVIPDIFRGKTYFIEPIDKEENPWLYWIIVISWIWMALFSFSVLIIDY
ncbi:hypothetical protein [Aquimarina rhabdastrellae]